MDTSTVDFLTASSIHGALLFNKHVFLLIACMDGCDLLRFSQVTYNGKQLSKQG